MPVLEFGTGLLYGVPTSGNLPTNPSPTRLLLQEVTVEFKGDLKKLWTQSQMPIATARGKIDVTGKAKIVNYDPDPINQLFWAQSIAAGMEVIVDREQHAANASVTVTQGATFAQDNGVSYANGTAAGQMFIAVTSAPNVGQYSVNTTSGTYTFNAGEVGNSVYISYTYTNASRGKTITLNNQVMGYAPVCRMDLWGNFRNKVLGIRLNAATLGQWTYPTKLEDFWISDITFDANTDSSDSLGKIFADTF